MDTGRPAFPAPTFTPDRGMTLRPNSARKKVRCGSCGRKVKDLGLWQHYVSVHEEAGWVAKMKAQQDIRRHLAPERAA